MTTTPVSTDARVREGAPAPPAARTVRTGIVIGGGLVAVAVLGLVHLTQGTSGIGVRELLPVFTGGLDPQVTDVLVGGRLPRLLAGLAVGLALGIAGALLQSVSRNGLAAPDTLGVNAGAYLAVVLAAVWLPLGALPSAAVAFAGGLAAAGLVLVVASGARSGPTRIILAGAVATLALTAVTHTVLLLKKEATIGLYAWGNGSLVQNGSGLVLTLAPVLLAGTVVALALSRRLDVLALGDDTARVLGIAVGRTRALTFVVAVLLAAVAVTIAGPIGFVGLLAPTLVRLLGVARHAALLPASAIAGGAVVLGADVVSRFVLGGDAGVSVPTGVVTSVAGAPVLVFLAWRHRDSGATRTPPGARHPVSRTGRSFAVVTAVTAAVLVAATVAGVLLGDRMLLLGDVANWLRGAAGNGVTFVLDQRVPRVAIALLAGAALGLAGAAVQAVARNPLAEPGIIGVSAGAGVGAVFLLVLVPLSPPLAVSAAAAGGGLAAFALVYAIAWRGRLSADRFVLVGIGVSALAASATTMIVLSSSYEIQNALAWLSGTTYGRFLPDAVPLAVVLALAAAGAAAGHRHLDLLALDDDTPRVLGVRLERVRLAVLAGAALLAAAAVAAVGVIGFVGLVAPHAARALVGGRHARVLVVAPLLGAALVTVADTVGRTVIAPAQLPAGLIAAMLGTPYFLWLLRRSRG